MDQDKAGFPFGVLQRNRKYSKDDSGMERI